VENIPLVTGTFMKGAAMTINEWRQHCESALKASNATIIKLPSGAVTLISPGAHIVIHDLAALSSNELARLTRGGSKV